MSEKTDVRIEPAQPARRSRVRVVDEGAAPDSPGRRVLLRRAAQGAGAGFVFGLLGADVRAETADSTGIASTPRAGAAPGVALTPGRIVRDFSDPYLELVRLLREAAEIEHSLMIQYLYCAFSLKPVYQPVAGFGSPNTDDLLGVSIQEMQHLGKVNQLLVALGASPTLIREDFPYEPDIYPFRFNLEPGSRASLAKYVWTESPPGATDLRKAKTREDRAFCMELERALGASARPNFVGSLYDAVIAAVEELDAQHDASLPDLKPWVSALHSIKQDGEVGHYRFFRRVFMGTHEGFGGRAGVWDRPLSDPYYPAVQVPTNPTAYAGHENHFQDARTLGLAWLGNLHYWITLALLTQGYSHGSQEHIARARAHMMGAVWSLARQLSAAGAGMPFDPLSVGYAPGLTDAANGRFLARLLGEADKLTQRLSAYLPADFPADCCQRTRATLARLDPVKLGRAPAQPWDDGLA
jgi:hypothetical protein